MELTSSFFPGLKARFQLNKDSCNLQSIFFQYSPCLCTIKKKKKVTFLIWNEKYLINCRKIQTQKNPSITDFCLLTKFPQETSSVITFSFFTILITSLFYIILQLFTCRIRTTVTAGLSKSLSVLQDKWKI